MDSLLRGTHFTFSVIQIILAHKETRCSTIVRSTQILYNWTKTKNTFGAESYTGVILEFTGVLKVPMVEIMAEPFIPVFADTVYLR